MSGYDLSKPKPKPPSILELVRRIERLEREVKALRDQAKLREWYQRECDYGVGR
jgi:hypothetical protein